MTSNEIRKAFLQYFSDRDHTIVPSSSLVPADDPTLLFTNAGMVQFKEYFTGTVRPPYPRAVTAQKCVRAGGKHNDLETVGRTARHHTFFEMLGNFSFGDYFKSEAIIMAWELLTQELGIDADRLWATVHNEDDEAAALWPELTGISEQRVVRLGDKDNFWAMGDTGPCGPCSELIYDRGSEHECGPDCGIGTCDCDRWLELWNLVFMQYERDADGRIEPLPHPSIDTGMGLERIASVLQRVDSNYETDLFAGMIADLARRTSRNYDAGPDGMAFRVIVDHVRCACLLLTDGVVPGNDGRNYVLRRILRRAVRYGQSLGVGEPFLHEMVDGVAAVMGEAYPELVEQRERLAAIIRNEETRFHETLAEGTARAAELLAAARTKGSDSLSGRDAFLLYDTYGFPLDLTRDLAEEHGMTVNEPEFEEAMADQRRRARRSRDTGAEGLDSLVGSVGGDNWEFTGEDSRGPLAVDTEITDVAVDGEGKQGDRVAVTLAHTPFYAEAGGQVGDSGVIEGDDCCLTVTRTIPGRNGVPVHLAVIERGTPRVGQRVTARVDCERRLAIASHHTATHLLHYALRTVVGEHAVQSGSLVAPERLRFDYSHYEPLTPGQLAQIESMVNELIRADLPVAARVMSRTRAQESGAIALFGEKYGEQVRVVDVGAGDSRELCGGTHVNRTGVIGLFLVTAEASIGSGLRRIEAVAGEPALEYVLDLRQTVVESADRLKCAPREVVERMAELQDEHRRLQRECEQLTARLARGSLEDLMAGREVVDGVDVVAGIVPTPDPEAVRALIDSVRDRLDCGVAVFGARAGDRVLLFAGATRQAVDRGVHCGRLVGELAKMMDGGGGGRPDMAQAGGRRPERLGEVMDNVIGVVAGQIGRQ